MPKNQPTGIQLKRWLDIAIRIFRRLGAQNIGLLAAGIAFYGLLSVFPGITAVVALGGLVMDPTILMEQSETLSELLPDAGAEIVLGQLRDVAQAKSRSLSIAVLIALAVALYSASRAVENFIKGINVIYGVTEERGFLHLKALTLGLTLALILGLVFAVFVVAAVPATLAFLTPEGWGAALAFVLRWPILFGFGIAGIAVLYRYGPSTRLARWRWLTPGAVLACALWVAGSLGFSLYVQSFASYNETFGALGGVIVLLTWMWLSAFVVLFGAALDAELDLATPDRLRTK
ncbi:MAG: membrane protein [Sulfitobacter sp.]|jgi:membrane protein